MTPRATSVISLPIRTSLGLLNAGAARAKSLPDTLSRVPAEMLSLASQAGGLALQAGGLAARGYGELSQRGEQTVSLVRTRLGMGDAVPSDAAEEAEVGLTEDPFMGGPLEPVENLREAVFLTQEDAEEVAVTADGATLTHSELPLEDYDHLTLGALRSRIRTLDVPALVQLREYEQAHANRLTVIKSLDNRVAKLARDTAAELDVPAPPAVAPAPLPE